MKIASDKETGINQGCPKNSRRDEMRFDGLDPIATTNRLFNHGYELDKRGESDAAELVYRNSIELLECMLEQSHPQLGPAVFARLALEHGITIFHLGKLEGARASFSRAVEVLDQAGQNCLTMSAVE